MIKFEDIRALNSEKELCDPSILHIILGYLSKIKHTLYDVKVDTKNEELDIVIIAYKNISISINFLLWNNLVNIYIGEYGDHYAEDVKVSTEKDVNNFIKQLNILLASEIVEKNYSLAQNRKKYVYLFKFKSMFKKFSNLSFYPKFILQKKTKNYDPWIFPSAVSS